MAITRRWQTGWETGSVEEIDVQVGGLNITTLNSPYTGSYHLRGDWPNRYGYQNVPATRQIRCGFFFKGAVTCSAERFQIRAGGSELISLDMKSDGSVDLQVLGSVKANKPGMNSTSWHHIGVDVKIDSSSGWAYVYWDSVVVMSFSGNTGNSDITNVLFGQIGGAGSCISYFDDIYIDDTTGEGAAAVCPVLRMFHVIPNGNGNYAQWDGSDGNSVDNYLLVDERPPSSADYVATNVVDEFDSYAMGTISLAAGQTVEAVIPIVSAARQDASEEIAIGTRLSAVDLIGSDQTPSISYGFFWERQATKPGGGAWGQADIDAFEAVIKSRGSY